VKKPNFKRIDNVIAWIEANLDSFHMREGGTTCDLDKFGQKPSCGCTACFAGFAEYVGIRNRFKGFPYPVSFNWDGSLENTIAQWYDGILHNAATYLNLSLADAEPLFAGHTTRSYSSPYADLDVLKSRVNDLKKKYGVTE
jgi:hypothetical protein